MMLWLNDTHAEAPRLTSAALANFAGSVSRIAAWVAVALAALMTLRSFL